MTIARRDATEVGPAAAGARCPICGAPPRVSASGFPTAIAGRRVDLLDCTECAVRFAWPRVVPDGLYEAIYAQSHDLAGYSRYTRYAQRCARLADPLAYLSDQEDMYWAVARSVARLAHPSASRIVEIGSGLGYLTHALRRAGYDCVGVDISRAAVASARARFGPWYERVDIFEPGSERAGRFDVAILLETIEHVVDPVRFLAATARLLEPGGAIVLTTPDRDAHPEGAVWRTDPPPVHLSWFGARGIERLAARVGMTAEFVDFTDYHRSHVQTVPALRPDETPAPWFDAGLHACRSVPWRTAVLEQLRRRPAVARAVECAYGRLRRDRTRLTARGFSLAAVLTARADPGGLR